MRENSMLFEIGVAGWLLGNYPRKLLGVVIIE